MTGEDDPDDPGGEEGPGGIERERRRLSWYLDEVAGMGEGDLPPERFYRELLTRLLQPLAAVAGSVWIRSSQDEGQHYPLRMEQVDLEGESARQSHDALLRLAFSESRPLHLPPHATLWPPEKGRPTPGNPSAFLLLLVPIRLNNEGIGLIEVFQTPNRPPQAIPGFLQYMALMAGHAERYQRNLLVRQMARELTELRRLGDHFDSFVRLVHSSLDPRKVSRHIADEGRRLIECDRVYVAHRRGGQGTQVEAISGCDLVENLSPQLRLLGQLCEEVLQWNEPLVYSGNRGDRLPARVIEVLDPYLAGSPCKLLVVQPLLGGHEGLGTEGSGLRPRSALVLECFESSAQQAYILSRLNVVVRHAAGALYNAFEYQRIVHPDDRFLSE